MSLTRTLTLLVTSTVLLIALVAAAWSYIESNHELEELFDAETVTLHLNTLLGSLDKPLTKAEKDAMRRFRDRAMKVHEEAQLSSSDD